MVTMKNKIRLVFQIIILGLIGYVAIRPVFDKSYLSDFESYCPFGGIASLGSKLNQGTMSCNMSEIQLLLGIGLLIGVIIVGKLFCGYLCPIGSITEWFGKIGEKFKMRIELPNFLDRPFRLLKYIILFLALYYTMTSSELFCKEFDPYFASVNLFDNTDIVLYLAIPAFIITILGTIFFRLFWCKYLCPLGAISNIFLNAISIIAAIILFVIANLLGANLSYVWLIIVIVVIGIITELGFMKSVLLPLPKIFRNKVTCTDCKICDSYCPQGIKISEFEKVNHIDCNLCTDCVYACPHKNVLTVNNKKSLKYLAPVATVIFILVFLGASSKFEFTTIAERWSNFDKQKNIEVFELSGVKNIKCYGSSMSLKNNLENVEGIYGLDTYAKSHTVKVYYNPSEISEKKVKASIFTPIKMEIQKLKPNTIDSLATFEAGIYGLFDLIDFNNLFYTLKEDEGVYGFETHFGEPVIADIFYDPQKTNPEKIKAQIQKEKITVKKPTTIETVELNFRIKDQGVNKGFINVPDYKQRIFRIYDRKFNEYKKYDYSSLLVFKFPFPDAGVPNLRRFLGSLSSHLSADNGIVRLSTRYDKIPVGYIFYDPKQTNANKIKEALVKTKLTIFITEKETKEIDNPFKIKPDGITIPAKDLIIDEE